MNNDLNIQWEKAKEDLKDLIEPKYFDFIESHESYSDEGIVNIVEVVERTSGYSNYPHCRIFGGEGDSRIYIKHETELETYKRESKYEGSRIEYWVWQTVGYCDDDYSGYLLLPMSDGRYWRVSYAC